MPEEIVTIDLPRAAAKTVLDIVRFELDMQDDLAADGVDVSQQKRNLEIALLAFEGVGVA